MKVSSKSVRVSPRNGREHGPLRWRRATWLPCSALLWVNAPILAAEGNDGQANAAPAEGAIRSDSGAENTGASEPTSAQPADAALSAALDAEPAVGADAARPDSSADERLEDSEEPSTWSAGFSMVEEYRLRRASNVLVHEGQLGAAIAPEDQLDQRLRLHSDAQIDGADDHFRALFSGALWWDIDGRPAQGTPNLFVSQYDNTDPWVAPYALSAEWHDHGVLDHIRVGRQDAEHGMPLTFDGASLGLKPWGPPLLLFAFGGQTVHFFETMPGLFEDWVGATGAVIRPMPSLRLELDARIIKEGVADLETGEEAPLINHSYGLAASTKTERIYGKLYVRGIEEQLSHAGGAMQFHLLDARFGIDARLDAQLVELGEIVESENPFFSLLGPSLPYARFRFEAWKEFELNDEALWSLHAGWRGRQLISDEEQPFNRNSGGLYLHSRIDDLLSRGLFLEGSAEWNYVPGSLNEGWLLALGGSAGYKGSALRTEVGTYYQRFKINYYQRAEELQRARSIFASAAYRITDWLEVSGRYELEIVDRYLESFYLSARQDF